MLLSVAELIKETHQEIIDFLDNNQDIHRYIKTTSKQGIVSLVILNYDIDLSSNVVLIYYEFDDGEYAGQHSKIKVPLELCRFTYINGTEYK